MERYYITKEQYNALKPVASFGIKPNINASIEEKNGNYFILAEDIEDVLDAISDYIYFRCMDDKQESCNKEGQFLYSLYDEIVYREPDE